MFLFSLLLLTDTILLVTSSQEASRNCVPDHVILNIPKTVTQKEVKSGWRKVLRQEHPGNLQ